MSAIKEEKTALQWFQILKEPYRQQAIDNATEQNADKLKNIYKSLADAINNCIVWHRTNYEYQWSKIHKCSDDYIEKEVSYEVY